MIYYRLFCVSGPRQQDERAPARPPAGQGASGISGLRLLERGPVDRRDALRATGERTRLSKFGIIVDIATESSKCGGIFETRWKYRNAVEIRLGCTVWFASTAAVRSGVALQLSMQCIMARSDPFPLTDHGTVASKPEDKNDRQFT